MVFLENLVEFTCKINSLKSQRNNELLKTENKKSISRKTLHD